MINFFCFQNQYNIGKSVQTVQIILNEVNVSQLLETAKEKSSYDYIILSVYFKMYYAMMHPLNDKYYFEFKKLFIENDNVFCLLERYGLYICMTNICVMKIDRGDDRFFKECFEVYEIMLEKHLFDAYRGFLSMTTFTAVLTTGVAAKEFDKLEKFIAEFSDKLNPEHKQDAVSYSLAQ